MRFYFFVPAFIIYRRVLQYQWLAMCDARLTLGLSCSTFTTGLGPF